MTPPNRDELGSLKARVDLVELIRQSGLVLKKKGKSWMCRCPFHEDSEASLSINGKEGLWNCFGCEAGGDHVSFLQLKENLEFPAALERLRTLAGSVLVGPVVAPDSQEKGGESPAMPEGFRRPELLARVAELYRKRFQEVADGRDYMSGRGLTSPELWKAFGVGFCDGTLRKTLPDDGPLLQALTALGVLRQDGKEHFRGCLVVPLSFPDQGVVGFYGRRIRADAKFRHLYLPGPHQGVLNWQSLRSAPSVVLAESVLDAMSLWQSGVRNVSSLFGCQGLPGPLKDLLQRFGVSEVTWALDGDRAGLEAVLRLTPELRQLGLNVSSVRLPEGKDANQLLQEQGATALEKLLQTKENLAEAASSAPAEMLAGGLQMELRGVHYALRMMAPFTNRLRANLRAHKDDKWVQDRFDLYLHRDRMRLVQQLTSQLGLARMESERQVQEVFGACEEWARQQRQQNPTPEQKAASRPPLSSEEKQTALAWLRKPWLARRILEDMAQLGYVGEENAKLLVYLIGISRKLPKPLSGIILSQSGCGKSTLTDLVEGLTPPEEVLVFTRITAQALIYLAEGVLKGKLLIVEERTGAEAAEYSIRILQSKQHLQQAVPMKDPTTGKITTQIIRVEGPVAYLETTTDPKINHENATRCFEITLDESEEQTERIHQTQRQHRLPGQNRHRLAEQIRTRHHNAQRLLESILVFIPFAEQLTFPSKKLRNRRDHERFLCLIEASAFLHQFQRERGQTEDGEPYVLASLEDYELAFLLAKDVLALTMHELSRGSKDVWMAAKEWVLEQAGEQAKELVFTRRDLRQATGIEDHQLRSALQELVDMEYVEVVSGTTGRAFQYRLLIFREEDVPMPLLAPQELARRLSS